VRCHTPKTPRRFTPGRGRSGNKKKKKKKKKQSCCTSPGELRKLLRVSLPSGATALRQYELAATLRRRQPRSGNGPSRVPSREVGQGCPSLVLSEVEGGQKRRGPERVPRAQAGSFRRASTKVRYSHETPIPGLVPPSSTPNQRITSDVCSSGRHPRRADDVKARAQGWSPAHRYSSLRESSSFTPETLLRQRLHQPQRGN